jgi:hypothetical protein
MEAKARALAGLKGCATNIANPTPSLRSALTSRLQIEKTLRMAKSDLAACPISTAPKTRSKPT